jgi:hypothetical protein
VSTRVRGNLAASAAQSALLAGVQKVTVELVFKNGAAVVPPLIANQPEFSPFSAPFRRFTKARMIRELVKTTSGRFAEPDF